MLRMGLRVSPEIFPVPQPLYREGLLAKEPVLTLKASSANSRRHDCIREAFLRGPQLFSSQLRRGDRVRPRVSVR